MDDKITIPALGQMKRDGRKIVCVVAWDYQTARIVDRAGVDIVSVGDSGGINLWGHASPQAVTLDEMILLCQAVRRGVSRALVSCDFPFGPLQEGPGSAVRAAIRLVKEAGAALVKLDGAAAFPEAVSAVVRAGVPVFAQFGITPQTALRHGVDYGALGGDRGAGAPAMTDDLVAEARLLEGAGAGLLNFTNSGPVVGPPVTAAVSIRVLGGFGGPGSTGASGWCPTPSAPRTPLPRGAHVLGVGQCSSVRGPQVGCARRSATSRASTAAGI